MPKIDPQQLYDEIQALKEQRKILKDSIKDHYDNSPEFRKIKEELDAIKEKKRAYDLTVKEAYAKDFEEISRLSEEIKADEELLSDLAFQELMNNNSVEIKDPKGNNYEPVIKVVFRKI